MIDFFLNVFPSSCTLITYTKVINVKSIRPSLIRRDLQGGLGEN